MYRYFKTQGVFLKIFYFWLCCIFIAALGLSLVVKSGGLALVVVHGLLLGVAFLVADHRLHGIQ